MDERRGSRRFLESARSDSIRSKPPTSQVLSSVFEGRGSGPLWEAVDFDRAYSCPTISSNESGDLSFTGNGNRCIRCLAPHG